MTADLVLAGLNVSRGTEQRLKDFVQLLEKWNSAVNLISRSTVGQVWIRHILDSAQIFRYGSAAKRWVDLGSGGGFPGIVVAILAFELAPDMKIILVESDQRKAAFLRQTAQTLGLSIDVIAGRIEAISSLTADVVSARALAPLPQLCAFAKSHLAPDGAAIFLKGKSGGAEIDDARKDWKFSLESHASITDPTAVVLVLKEISNV